MNAMGETEDARANGFAMLATAESFRDQRFIANALTRNAELAFFLGEWEDVTTYTNRVIVESYESLGIINISALKDYETGEFTSANATMGRIMERRSSLANRLEGFT